MTHVLPWGGLSSLPWVPEFWNQVIGSHFSHRSLRILSKTVPALPWSGKLGDFERKLCGAPWMEEIITLHSLGYQKSKDIVPAWDGHGGVCISAGETGKPPRQWGSKGLGCREGGCSYSRCGRSGKPSWGDGPSPLAPHTFPLKQTPCSHPPLSNVISYLPLLP